MILQFDRALQVTMRVDRSYVQYDASEQIVRYGSANTIESARGGIFNHIRLTFEKHNYKSRWDKRVYKWLTYMHWRATIMRTRWQ
jgi:hypothetical protein